MSILVYKHLVVLSHFSIEIFVFSISCHHNQIVLRPIKIGFWNSVAKNWVLKIKTWNIFWLCFLPVRLPMGLWLWLHVVILLGPRVYPRLPLLLRCLLVLGLSIDSDIPVIKLVSFHLALELDLAVHTFLTFSKCLDLPELIFWYVQFRSYTSPKNLKLEWAKLGKFFCGPVKFFI